MKMEVAHNVGVSQVQNVLAVGSSCSRYTEKWI